MVKDLQLIDVQALNYTDLHKIFKIELTFFSVAYTKNPRPFTFKSCFVALYFRPLRK